MFKKFLKKKVYIPLAIVEAADRGDDYAKEQLKRAFDKGLTSEEHNNLRKMAYTSKADQGDPFAQYWMGFLSSMIDKNAEKTIFWYEKSAKQGNIDAMRDLAFGYGEFLNTYGLDNGPIGLGYDEEKELYWLRMAAEAGDMPSLAELQQRRK